MSSFDILSKEISLQPRLFLEASAGTGKTFTIEHLVVRLLLETSMRLDEIVVVTFTRAATRELKERIHNNLQQVALETLSHPYLQGLTDLQKNKIQVALKSFDIAQIFTIHGFCSHLLSHFALEAGVGLKLSEWTPEEEEWEIKEFLRTQPALSPGQIKKLLGSVQYDLRRLIEKLHRFSAPASIPSSEELLAEVQKQLALMTPFSVAEEFERIRPSYKGMTSDDFSSQAAELEKALLEKNLSSKTWEKWITTSPFFLKNLDPSQLKARAKPITSEPLSHLREIILPRLEKAQDPRQILVRLGSAWSAHRKKVSELHEKITPDDLLKIVHSKLSIPAFVEAVRKKYQAVIVDEFQDTDPIQWDIFRTLFLEDPKKSVYLVGDPKQSIYAFRQADIYTFLDAACSFGVDQKAALVRNFRSSSELIEKLNNLFCQNSWMDLPKQSTYLDIPKAVSFHEGEGTLCFMVAEGEKGRGTKWPTSEMEEMAFFPFIVEEIQKQNLKPADVAILVKDRYQAGRVRAFLDRYRMPSVVYRSSPLGESPVLEFMHEIAEVCIDPQESTLKKILVGPFAAVSIVQLTPELVLRTKEKFKELQTLWIEEGFATFFAEFLKTSFGKESALSTFYHFQDHAHYDDLLELTQKVLFVHHPSQLKALLEDLKNYETEDRICTHPDGIQIMTTHASKGLEFETVFALGLASRSPTQELPPEELKELDAEKMRQFYVALTRAKKRLYIPIAIELPTPDYALGEGSPIELFLSKAKPDLTSFSQEFLNGRTFHLKLYQTPTHGVLTPPPPLKSASVPRFMQSFSSLAQEITTPTKGEEKGLAAGVETGIIVHRILERYFNQESDLDTLIVQETKRTKLASQAETLQTLLHKTLELSLGDFCLNDISLSKVQTEMEFLYTTEQGWMKGYIDLCFEHEGKLYVVDWKTNLIENTDPSSILEVMQSHDYLLQGKIYTEALQRYLKHFPSLTFGGAYFIFIRGPAYYV